MDVSGGAGPGFHECHGRSKKWSVVDGMWRRGGDEHEHNGMKRVAEAAEKIMPTGHNNAAGAAETWLTRVEHGTLAGLEPDHQKDVYKGGRARGDVIACRILMWLTEIRGARGREQI